MLNAIWGGMIITGVIYGVFSGNMEIVGNGIVDSAREAVSLAISMAGVVALWSGLMEIAKEAGIIRKATRLMRPVMSFLFPKIPKEDEALEHITVNVISNIFGLGAAATPAGLRAMNALERLDDERIRQVDKKTKEQDMAGRRKVRYASDEMCTFMVLNISSLQLIPVNMIAYRGQYGSADPMVIVGPAIAATLFSTVVAVIFVKLMCAIKTGSKLR